MLSHRAWGEARQVALLRLGAHAPSFTGCPIEREEGGQIEAIPDDAAQEGEQAGEAVAPAVQEGLETKQYVEQQGGPHLPAHGIGTVPQEVAQLQGLLD